MHFLLLSILHQLPTSPPFFITNTTSPLHTQENIRTHVPQISSLNAEIAFQDRTKRNVRDNIDVRETERELVRLEKMLEEMEGKEGGGSGALRDAQR